MNTAIEATYNINVPPAVLLARRAPPLASISLPPTLSRGSIQNGHINLIISSVIRLADEERLGTDVGYPYQEWCQCSLLCSLCYARLGPAPRRSSDGYRTLSSYSSPCLLGTPSWSTVRLVAGKSDAVDLVLVIVLVLSRHIFMEYRSLSEFSKCLFLPHK